jgi:hypothetical protein
MQGVKKLQFLLCKRKKQTKKETSVSETARQECSREPSSVVASTPNHAHITIIVNRPHNLREMILYCFHIRCRGISIQSARWGWGLSSGKQNKTKRMTMYASSCAQLSWLLYLYSYSWYMKSHETTDADLLWKKSTIISLKQYGW